MNEGDAARRIPRGPDRGGRHEISTYAADGEAGRGEGERRRFLQRSIRNYVAGRLSVPLEDAVLLVGFSVPTQQPGSVPLPPHTNARHSRAEKKRAAPPGLGLGLGLGLGTLCTPRKLPAPIQV